MVSLYENPSKVLQETWITEQIFYFDVQSHIKTSISGYQFPVICGATFVGILYIC